MPVFLLRLAGPMQSWGTQSRFRMRDTGREPSKSGVIGLLCAALGRPRSAPVDDLAALKMGVRVDREGSVGLDYHTAGGAHRRGERYGVVKADGSRGDPVPSSRYYLADADFLVGLEGDEALLREIDQALAQPKWSLFLGRKAFVPGLPVRLPDEPPWGPGLRDGSLREVLVAYPWPDGDDGAARLRFVLDVEAGSTAEVRADVPLSFELGARQFATRCVQTEFIARATTAAAGRSEVGA